MRRLRRKRRVPSRAERRQRSPQIPRAVELFYMRAMRAVARSFAAAVRANLPDLSQFAKPEDVRTDAKDDVDKTMPKLRKAAAKSLKQKEFDAVSGVTASRVVKHSQSEFKRLGIKLVDAEPKLGKMIDTWRQASVARITAMHEDQLGKVEKILRDGQGFRVEEIAKQLEWQLDDVSTSRAELIARDQVLTLNAKVTEERQGACGIESYVWTTSNDERVRDEHDALEGHEFTWESGGDPEEGNPGEAIQCRCTAFPILPELADDE